LRGLAKDTPIEKLRVSCLKSAEQFDLLAKMAAEEEARANGTKVRTKTERALPRTGNANFL
jgi:hypothetical protein